MVAARMDRQRLLIESDIPAIWNIVDEVVIRRVVGDQSIMHEQISRLLTLVEAERIRCRVIPFSIRRHPGLSGPFKILSFRDKPDVVYVEGVGSGSMLSDPGSVEELSPTFGSLQGVALSTERSAELLETVGGEFGGTRLAQVQL